MRLADVPSMREPSLTHTSAAVFLGDCLDVLAEIPDNSIDAIVTDPPYGLGFMGKAWDDLPPGLPWAQECLRVLKPGGHLLAFGGTRTWHRLAVAVEDAGFEVRDSIAWLYGSGFPKSLDVSKAIDKRPGVQLHAEFARHLAERREASGMSRADVSERVVGTRTGAVWNWEHHQFPEAKWWPALRDLLGLDDETWGPVIAEAERAKTGRVLSVTGARVAPSSFGNAGDEARSNEETAPATPAAQQWAGWGTALKPAFEPIVVARKPLIGTVAANVLAHGTGAVNIDATRVGDGSDRTSGGISQGPMPQPMSWGQEGRERTERASGGRWPANVLLDGDAAAELDADQPVTTAGAAGKRGSSGFVDGYQSGDYTVPYGDTGGPSRYFPTFRYQAKAPTRERPSYFRPTCDCENAWPTPTTSQPRATDGTTEPGSSSTSRSGSGSTGAASPTDTTSTTVTSTSSTTTPATSSPSLRPTTSGSTPDANSGTESGGSPAESAESSSPSESPIGTSAAKAGRSTAAAALATSPSWSATSVCGGCGAPTRRESHATVKPLALMRWLVRLVTPPGGTVLDTFAGSGATIEAAIEEGFYALGIEREESYLPLIQVRLDRVATPGVAA